MHQLSLDRHESHLELVLRNAMIQRQQPSLDLLEEHHAIVELIQTLIQHTINGMSLLHHGAELLVFDVEAQRGVLRQEDLLDLFGAVPPTHDSDLPVSAQQHSLTVLLLHALVMQ